MRRYLILLGVGSLLLVSLVAVTSSATPTPLAPNCTINGTPQRDVLPGSNRPDVICTRGSGDYSAGGGARDTIRGDGGKDTLIGGKGEDTLAGHAGNDHLFTVDNRPGDIIKGGKGLDQCYGDVGDRFRSCEQIHRGGSIATAMALSNQFFGALTLADVLIPDVPIPTPPPPPGTTVTVTVLITVPVPFPPCVPPPSIPPTPCVL